MTVLRRSAFPAPATVAAALLLAACGSAAPNAESTAAASGEASAGAHGEESADSHGEASADPHGEASADSHGEASADSHGATMDGHGETADTHAEAAEGDHGTGTTGDGAEDHAAGGTDGDLEARLAALEAAVFGAGGHEAAHWDYAGAATWGELSPDYASCAAGTQQSPIDLVTPVITGGLQVTPAYHSSTATVTDNGHTVQVDLTDGGSADIAGTSYQLVQFHFHAPSEHTVNGEHSPVEMHLVHKDAEGNLAVIGVMITEGEANGALAGVLAQIPAAGEKVPLTAAIDPTTLLPPQLMLYRYMGSLTTPPCTEGVVWSVLAMPITMSAEQIATLTSHFKEANNRPVQPLNGRDLTFGLPVGG